MIIPVRDDLVPLPRQTLQPAAKPGVGQHVPAMVMIRDHQQRTPSDSQFAQLGQHRLENRARQRAHVVERHDQRAFGASGHGTVSSAPVSNGSASRSRRRRNSAPRKVRHVRKNAIRHAAARHAAENTSPCRV